jgi:hypothetical protein
MPDPTVRELLLARVDEHLRVLEQGLAHLGTIVEQLEPDRARSCRNAVAMCAVMLDEIRLRAHAQPVISDDD